MPEHPRFDSSNRVLKKLLAGLAGLARGFGSLAFALSLGSLLCALGHFNAKDAFHMVRKSLNE